MRLRSGSVSRCRGKQCFTERGYGHYTKRSCSCESVLRKRCPNAHICGALPVPEYRSGFCPQCTATLSCTKINTLPETGECAVCLADNKVKYQSPAGCAHGFCGQCFKQLFIGPDLPMKHEFNSYEKYCKAVVDWFADRPQGSTDLRCPLCRSEPNSLDRLHKMMTKSVSLHFVACLLFVNVISFVIYRVVYCTYVLCVRCCGLQCLNGYETVSRSNVPGRIMFINLVNKCKELKSTE
jgi:hypothetical protein